MEKEEFVALDKEFVNKYKNKQVPWGFNGLGYIVFKRTYARQIEGENRTEEWYETIERCINGSQKIGAGYTKEEAEELFDLMFNLKCNMAGRMLWQLGTGTVDKLGIPSLCNCWFLSIKTIEDFCFLFNHLMLGGGVGFSVKKEHIHELPKVKTNVKIIHERTKDADFIIPDSREGWVELLRKVLHSFFLTGKGFSYSSLLIREAGEPIKTFGGKASGYKVLVDGVSDIIKVLSSREGKKLRSVDVLDICNIIGSIVVSGNVRRSAEIAIGDPDDYLYVRAKNWSTGTIPNWRAMSNNSIEADSYEQISNEIWNGYDGSGEPYGFINLKLARTYGRLGEKVKDNVEGVNPCAESTLEDKEPCNLAEIYLNNISSLEEMKRCAFLLYKTQKAILTLPSMYEETEKVIKRNMRIGLGVTGICQSLGKLEWLDETYKALRQFDIEWSKKRGWNKSIKLTVIKPSGTLSLLAGSTPGIHPAFSSFYIRRVRMASNDSLVQLCRDAGYKVEYQVNFDGTENRDTVVVEFPCKAGEDSIITKDMSAVKQLELVKKIQTVWADQSVSVTVYYKKEELPEIKEWLKEHYEKSLKTVSFLLHNEHGFEQAPYEEITEEKYNEIKSKIKPISINTEFEEIFEGLDCEGGACPVR